MRVSVLFGIIVGFQVFADDFRISFTPAPGGDGSPAVAWNGSRFLVVWWKEEVYKFFTDDIYGQFVSDDGMLIDTNFPILADTLRKAMWPDVASDSTNYLVVWHEKDSTESYRRVYGQLVAPSGSLIDTNIGIALGSDTNWFSAIAYGDTIYLVVWEKAYDIFGGDIYGQLVSRSGILMGSNFLISPPFSIARYPGVASSDTNFLVVYEKWGNIYGKRVGFNGNVIGGEIPICTADSMQGIPEADFDGTSYLVVWHDKRSGEWQTYGQFVSPQGVLIDTNFLIIPSNGWAPGVSWDGTNYLVVAGESEYERIKGQFVSSNGALVGSNFNVSTFPETLWSCQNRSAISWGATNYLVVWQNDSTPASGDTWIYGNIVQPVGIEEFKKNQVLEPKLQVYPNPFRLYTIIRYSLIRGENVSISIYDITGREVKTLVNEWQKPGEWRLIWDGRDNFGKLLGKGIYFLNLSSDKFITTQKVIIVR